jgi:hypothetical protein
MKTSEMKKDIKRTYPDAKIKPVQSGSYKFEVVVTEFGREKIIGRGSQESIAWRNAYNELNF